MSTHPLSPPREGTFLVVRSALLALAAVAAAIWLAIFGLGSGHALTHVAAPALLIALAVWMFFSERYEVTLAVLLLYLGLFDGVLKLKTGSELATLGRDVLLYAVALGVLARAILRKERLTAPPLLFGVLAWVAVCLVQLANPANVSLLHAAAGLRQHLEFVPLFFLGYMVLRSERRLAGLFLLLIAVAAVNGIVSLIQWQLTPDQLAGWGPGYSSLVFGTEHISGRGFVAVGTEHVRPPALGSDMGFGGAVGMIALPGLIALLTDRRWRLRFGWLLLPAAPLVILAVWTSQARVGVVSSVVAVVAFLALTLTSRRGAAALIATVVVGLTAYAAISTLSSGASSPSGARYEDIAPTRVIDTTVSYRKATLALIPTYMAKYPFGAGIGSVGPAGGVSIGGAVTNTHLNAESEFTFLLVETGIPGLLVMLTLTLAVIALGIRLRRVADILLQRSLMALTAVLIAIFATWIVGPPTPQPPLSPFFWLAAGALAYWYNRLRAGRLVERPNRLTNALVSR